MTRKNTTSKASLAGRLSAVTLAIGAMTPMLSACNNGQQGSAPQAQQTAAPKAQQAQKAGASNPCAPQAQSSSPANPCAPQAQTAGAANPCAPQPAKSEKKDCPKAANPCAPAPKCDDNQG